LRQTNDPFRIRPRTLITASRWSTTCAACGMRWHLPPPLLLVAFVAWLRPELRTRLTSPQCLYDSWKRRTITSSKISFAIKRLNSAIADVKPVGQRIWLKHALVVYLIRKKVPVATNCSRYRSVTVKLVAYFSYDQYQEDTETPRSSAVSSVQLTPPPSLCDTLIPKPRLPKGI
jgi:hypothetical protein